MATCLAVEALCILTLDSDLPRSTITFSRPMLLSTDFQPTQHGQRELSDSFGNSKLADHPNWQGLSPDVVSSLEVEDDHISRKTMWN